MKRIFILETKTKLRLSLKSTPILLQNTFLTEHDELQKIEKTIVSVFVVDNHSFKSCGFTNVTVIKLSTSLKFKPQRVIKSKGFFVWEILLPTPADCESVSTRDLLTKYLSEDQISRQASDHVSVYDFPPQIDGENLTAYLY